MVGLCTAILCLKQAVISAIGNEISLVQKDDVKIRQVPLILSMPHFLPRIDSVRNVIFKLK